MPTFTWTGFAGIQSYVDNDPKTYPYQFPLTIDIQDAKVEAGTPLIVWNQLGQDNQMWELVSGYSGDPKGYYFIQSKMPDAKTGKPLVIDIQGGSATAAS